MESMNVWCDGCFMHGLPDVGHRYGCMQGYNAQPQNVELVLASFRTGCRSRAS